MKTMTNHVQIIGNLGKDPEVKTTSNGKKYARFSVAAKESFTSTEGKRVDNVQWVNFVAWENNATIAEKYLHKGKQVAIAGKLSIKEYTDSNGEKKTATEIVVQDILLLGNPSKQDA